MAGWDDHVIYGQRIRNYTAQPIEVEVRRAFDGHVIFRNRLADLNHDYRTVQFSKAIEPGESADLLYEILRRMGHKAKQNNVTVEEAEIQP